MLTHSPCRSGYAPNGVPYGMPEIEHAAQAPLPFVRLDNCHLDAQCRTDQLLPGNTGAPVLQPREHGGVRGGEHLDDLRHAAGVLTRIQRLQYAGVSQHRPRLVEGADYVLVPVKVHGDLAPDRGIHHGKQGGRQVVKVDPAHIGRRDKPAEIPYHAAADRHQRIAAVKACLQHDSEDGKPCIGALVRLARLQRDKVRLGARIRDRLRVGSRYAAVGQDQDAAAERKTASDTRQRAFLHCDRVAVRPQIHSQYAHSVIIPFSPMRKFRAVPVCRGAKLPV